jgi:hypothetical protein
VWLASGNTRVGGDANGNAGIGDSDAESLGFVSGADPGPDSGPGDYDAGVVRIGALVFAEHRIWPGGASAVIAAHGILDGCGSMADVIGRLLQTAALYSKMRDDGWEVRGVIENDAGTICHNRLDEGLARTRVSG